MRSLCFPNSSHHYYSNKAQLQSLRPPGIKPAGRGPRWVPMYSTATVRCRCRPLDEDDDELKKSKNKRRNKEDICSDKRMVGIFGPTGCGKTRLSIDLATMFAGEIINSDKMQLYQGLDITTNKLALHQRRGVPHHLLGDFDPADGELTASDYRSVASSAISDIWSRERLPILAGGSNSFIYGLLAREFDPESNVFDGSSSVSAELRYNCCFLWVYVAPPVLDEYLEKRVDDMLRAGMFEELAEFYDSEGVDTGTRAALRKAIGVPEFAQYFRRYLNPKPVKGKSMIDSDTQREGNVGNRREVYDEAVRAIKDNTCQLAKRQVGKIRRLREGGWNLGLVDATEVLRAVMASDSDRRISDEIWETQVLEPSVKIVKRFLEE
ncbi:adenylate isopentenyltransferase-like [Malania oleifera]|uniref:adenylate isopentenyltransferase-like n=1 Tax=Malania oleifera TaxID=397392 RepID=UPI0025AE2FB5|nr:adenylate isopentenyltransferase-like [Malania oleifera]